MKKALIILILTLICLTGFSYPSEGTISAPTGALWGYDTTNKKWRPIQIADTGAVSSIVSVLIGSAPLYGTITAPIGACFGFVESESNFRAMVIDSTGRLVVSGAGATIMSVDGVTAEIDPATTIKFIAGSGVTLALGASGEVTINSAGGSGIDTGSATGEVLLWKNGALTSEFGTTLDAVSGYTISAITVEGNFTGEGNATFSSGTVTANAFVGDGSGLTGVTAVADLNSGSATGEVFLWQHNTLTGEFGTNLNATAGYTLSKAIVSGVLTAEGGFISGLTSELDGIIVYTNNLFVSDRTSGHNIGIGNTNPKAAVHIGDGSGAPTNTMTTESLYVEGAFEVDGTSIFGNTIIPDSVSLNFGNSSDSAILFSAAQNPDSTFLGLDSGSRVLIVGDKTRVFTNYSHAQESHPEIFIHDNSATTTHWLGLQHNGTNGLIESGLGGIILSPEAQVLNGLTVGTNIYAGTGNITGAYIYGDGSNLTNVGASAATSVSSNVKNVSGGTLAALTPVYIYGSSGTNMTVKAASNLVAESAEVIGILPSAIGNNAVGICRRFGTITGVDTQTPGWNEGDELYLGDGVLTNVMPTSGRYKHVGTVEIKSVANGRIAVHQLPVNYYMAAAGNETLDVRMGDSAGATKVSFEDYTDTEVAHINSDGELKVTKLTVEGNVVVDTNTLFVNSSTNRVGIGNNAPSTALDVTGTCTATDFSGDGSGLTETIRLSVDAGATVEVDGLRLIAGSNVTLSRAGIEITIASSGGSLTGITISANAGATIETNTIQFVNGDNISISRDGQNFTISSTASGGGESVVDGAVNGDVLVWATSGSTYEAGNHFTRTDGYTFDNGLTVEGTLKTQSDEVSYRAFDIIDAEKDLTIFTIEVDVTSKYVYDQHYMKTADRTIQVMGVSYETGDAKFYFVFGEAPGAVGTIKYRLLQE